MFRVQTSYIQMKYTKVNRILDTELFNSLGVRYLKFSSLKIEPEFIFRV